MFRLIALASALCITSGSVWGAPATAAKPKKKEPAAPEKKEAPTDSHKVKRGETLWGIARLHGVSVGDLMDLNHLGDSTVLDGQILKIPRAASDPALAPTTATSHTVAKGETLRSIARKYGLTQDDLERANPKTDPATPKAGTKLTIPVTTSTADKASPDATVPKPQGTTHMVTEKDTYYTIAKKYGVTEAAIAAVNPDVNPDRLRPGSKLNIPPRPRDIHKNGADPALATGKKPAVAAAPKKPADEPDPESTANEKPKPKTRRYVVSADETPQTISEAFNIPLKQLYEMNGLKPGSPMKSGLEIQVPLSTSEIP